MKTLIEMYNSGTYAANAVIEIACANGFHNVKLADYETVEYVGENQVFLIDVCWLDTCADEEPALALLHMEPDQRADVDPFREETFAAKLSTIEYDVCKLEEFARLFVY